MTLDEARKIAAIIGTADGGCENCVGSLVRLVGEALPEFHWELSDDFYGVEPEERVRVRSAMVVEPVK